MNTALQRVCGIVSAGALLILAMLPGDGRAATLPRPPSPELSLSLSGAVDDTLEQGEPLRVTVLIEASADGAGAVELAPATGTWVSAIAVELLAAGKAAAVLRATAVGTPESPRATLDRERVAGGAWIFPATAMQGVPLGDYVVRARLSIPAGAGWSGGAVSGEATLRIVAVSSAPERVRARTLIRAQIALAENALEEAARLLDGVLTVSPDDIELLSLRADVALRGGNPLAAMICVNRASRALPSKLAGPPPLLLHEVRSRVLASQMAGTPTPAPASAASWTWPPTIVLTLPENEAAALQAKTSSDRSTSPRMAATQTPAATPAPGRKSAAPVSPAPMPPSAAAPGPSPAPVPTTPSRSGAPSSGTIVPAAELVDAKVRADPAGQWAASAAAGTQYGRGTPYSPSQATGAPNVPMAGNSPNAWCPAVPDRGMDWFEATFANPVRATEVRVRQNDGVGAIVKVEAIEPDGTSHVWWEGVDPYQRGRVREVVWFAVRVPTTPYLVARVKLTLNLAAGPGYKEIDAVQLVGTAP
jgi:hypothetical protein